eukprot:g48502.t1
MLACRTAQWGTSRFSCCILRPGFFHTCPLLFVNICLSVLHIHWKPRGQLRTARGEVDGPAHAPLHKHPCTHPTNPTNTPMPTHHSYSPPPPPSKLWLVTCSYPPRPPACRAKTVCVQLSSSTPKQTPVIVNIGTFQNQSTHEMMRDSRKLHMEPCVRATTKARTTRKITTLHALPRATSINCCVTYAGSGSRPWRSVWGTLPPKSVILQLEAERLRQVLNSRPAVLPPKATERLADATQALQKRKYNRAVTILRTEPVVWCAEALYHLGNCLESGRGLPTSDTDFAFLYWVCAINSCDPITPKSFYYLDLLWKLAQYRDRPGLNIVTEISCATPCQNSLLYFAVLARLVWSMMCCPKTKKISWPAVAMPPMNL